MEHHDPSPREHFPQSLTKGIETLSHNPRQPPSSTSASSTTQWETGKKQTPLTHPPHPHMLGSCWLSMSTKPIVPPIPHNSYFCFTFFVLCNLVSSCFLCLQAESRSFLLFICRTWVLSSLMLQVEIWELQHNQQPTHEPQPFNFSRYDRDWILQFASFQLHLQTFQFPQLSAVIYVPSTMNNICLVISQPRCLPFILVIWFFERRSLPIHPILPTKPYKRSSRFYLGLQN